MKIYDVIIIGGGLAGLTAAIDLSRFGCDILVFESNSYPQHKVCGEYVSKEVQPYLMDLGIDLMASGAVDISTFEISTLNGKKLSTTLPLGGLGISRYALDTLLYKKALAQGCGFKFSKVTDITFKDDIFHVANKAGECYGAKIVIGAYGKRSGLDKTLQRDFSFKKQWWLAVKGHYENSGFPKNRVALHNFQGGYAGLSKTEAGAVNFCYLAHYDNFRQYRSINDFNEKVVRQNKYLNEFLTASEPIFDHPLTIAQISFEKRKPVVDHILMCGDTAGLIHPLCGNGMAMAIHSAKFASSSIKKYLDEPGFDRLSMEQEYAKAWNTKFRSRLWFGRKLQGLLLQGNWLNAALSTSLVSEGLLKYIISKTHGKPIADD